MTPFNLPGLRGAGLGGGGAPMTLDRLVVMGLATVVNPTADTGWKRFGMARELMPAATNLVPDPQGVLADGTFWPADTAHTDSTANVDVPIPVPTELTGLTKCLRLVNDGTADTPATANLTVSASLSHFSSIYVYAPTLGGNLTIRANVKSGAHLFSVAALTGANTGWVRYGVYSPTVATETTLKLEFVFAGGTASTVYVTAAQVVQETTYTPFFCGLVQGSAWTGTVNASTSSRAVSDFYWPCPWATCPVAGTILSRVSEYAAAGAAAGGIVGIYTASTARAYLSYSGGKPRLWGSAQSISAANAAQYTAEHYVGRWDASGSYLRHNATDAAAGAALTTGMAVDRIYVGRGTGGAQDGPLVLIPSCIPANDPLMDFRNFADDTMTLFRLVPVGSLIAPMNGDSRLFTKVA